MADVLIVCVREDEPQAKALAEMFEAAGFSIGGAPSSDGALRSSGAGVVVWSQASIRSRPFLDAAQRVINADKAVVASLIEPPPPSSVGNSPSFDLSDWNGDPNDPSLDPLFFAVDRMVNSQRASAGAPVAEEPPAYEPPPPPRASPPPRALARPSPPSSNDPLSSESEHWRAIRDSRNPADFMDYLARYGPDGAFSEVAELRLKQLTGASERGQPRPRIDTPQQRREPPSVRRDPIVRPPPPPPRRMEAPASTPRRYEPPARQPSFDRPPPRGYNERPELRDPPKSAGGALRAIVLVALLGGVALAGGLYFGGGGLPDFGARTQTSSQTQEPASEPASTEPPSAQDSGTPLSEAAAPGRASVIPSAPRRDTPPPQRTASVEPRRDLNAAATIPNRVQPNSSSGGPISLVGPQSNAPSSTQTQGPLAPLGPQTDVPPTVLAANVPPPVVTPQPPGAVRWATRPTSRRIADLYPDSAARLGVGGRVDLDCVVTQSLSLTCRIAAESPPALGFGRAALSAANTYRAQPALSDGSGAVGAHTRISVQFQAPQ
jgi:TonB family protein